MIIKTKNANVEEETDCTEAAISQTVENEINIDPKKITNFIDRKLSAQCEQQKVEILSIFNSFYKVFKMFLKLQKLNLQIFVKNQVSEKLIKIFDSECFLSYSFHCTYFNFYQ